MIGENEKRQHIARLPSNSLDSQRPPGTTPLANANPAAFWFSVAGLAIQVAAFVMVVVMRFAFSDYGFGMFGMMGSYWTMMGPYYGGGWNAFAWIWILIGVISIALGIFGVMWMNSAGIGRHRSGSVLVLVAAILAFPTMWGFAIGSLLMFIGAIMGLTTVPGKT